ncbi:MAG: addiction module protein [Acidobacteria bacterium]|nr:addiction module protein [Acidobacteriota bacterium]MBV9069173.1 addiction module protein [Acidobacteriota bacterium]MBV9184637.1 addiction module protein [Acidobacteriota bacterium]
MMEELSCLAEQRCDNARTPEEREIDAAWDAEIDRRVAEVDARTAVLIPGDDVIRELRSKYGEGQR